ncbi:MAG: ATP-binding protein [Lachnospiraceae bacterium]|nr:ATP-binding protein [Lachnospiraceae bacterium]
MHRIIAQLLMYDALEEDCVLKELAKVTKALEEGSGHKPEMISTCFHQVKKILEVGTDYGFDKNLWHNYLTFLIITDENPFSLTSEKIGANEGSVNAFVKHDFKAFMDLFSYDFGPLEQELGIDCFTRLQNYQAIIKPELMYNRNVSEKVRHLSEALEKALDEEEFFTLVTEFYRDYGVGMFGLNKAFRIRGTGEEMKFTAINNMDDVVLNDLVGYEIQKKKLIENTESFVQGRKANNVLLFGDSGTGKSTSIKAIVNEYYKDGLRMIEIYKHQFADLSNVIAAVKNRNYKFIIYMDDLSFEEFEIEYKFLKAVIEGGVETKPDNVLIYATSNRRHLINETWKSRGDVEVNDGIHKSDTMQEQLSLVNRFGVTIYYGKPAPKEFYTIVIELARRSGITQEKMSDEELTLEANRWELAHGGISGRTAQQFVNYLLGTKFLDSALD